MVVLLHGNDRKALTDELNKYKLKYSEIFTFDLNEAIVSDITSNIYTNSLFSPDKLIIIRNIIGNSSQIEGLLKEFKENIVSDGTLVLFFSSEKIPSNLNFYKFVKENGEIIEKLVERVNVLEIVKAKSKEAGLELDDEVASFIALHLGQNYDAAEEEIKKIAMFKYPQKRLTKEDIESLENIISTYSDAVIWNYLDSISQKNKTESILLLTKLLSQGEDPLGILALLERQVRLLIFAKLNIPLGVAPFISSKIMRSSQNFNTSFLIFFYRKLQDAEYAAKTGSDAENIIFLLTSII